VDADEPGRASYPRRVQAGPYETVIFAWAVFASRQYRDRASDSWLPAKRLAACVPTSAPSWLKFGHGDRL
jgi:uncharacterized protein YbaA (DUF1428 family)